MTTIKLKNGSGAPLAGDLVQGEPALDLTNKRLYTENSSGTVIEVGTNPSTINIDAGTIDGTVIGGSTAAAGSFTTFTSTGIDDNAASTAITIDGSQNVGIGTASPSRLLTLSGTGATLLSLVSTDDDNCQILFGDSASDTVGKILYRHSDNSIAFETNAAEAMRIDSSGNLLVAKTGLDVGVVGQELRSSGFLAATRDGSTVGAYTRLNSDGTILEFRKDSSAVGSIGCNSGSFGIGQSNTGLGFFNTDRIVFPATSAGAVQDNAIDLGYASGRFKNLYLSGTANAGAISAGNSEFAGSGGAGGFSLKATFSGATKFSVQNTGNVSISGALSKGSGSFKIDHPLPAKTATHHLVHSFVESPQADNIYRGKIDLVDGSATVNIDTAAGMTEGTYVLLNTNTQCFTSNESGWTAVKGSVSGNTLTITAQDNTCTDTISWMIVGERQDQHMIDTDWTDDNGKVIVEPLKESN